MDNAFENENLDAGQGQVSDNVGQDESGTQNEGSSQDWESQAKYFQSEKDKLQSENQKLKDYEKVGKLENAVKLEAEKLRLRGQSQEKQERLQNKGE